MILALIVFLVTLSVLVFVHEFGHFIVAKWSGMRVDEFALGFPPHIWTKKKGDTLYCINAIPFGGYVKIHGENPEPEEDDEPRSFEKKPVYLRMAVIVAGVVMNLLFAFVVLTIAFSFGFVSISQDLNKVPGATIKESQIAIAELQKGGPAEQAGLQTGDYVTSFVDRATGVETPISDVEQFRSYTKAKQAEGHTDLTVNYQRDGVNGQVEAHISGGILGVFIEPVQTVRVPVLQAPKVAIKEIGAIIQLTWDALKGFAQKLFIHGKLDQTVSGPIGMYQATASATKMGFVPTIFLVVALSVNLALFNILPIPVLDGGKFLFLLIEGIFGRNALSRELENKIVFVSFVALIGLIAILSVRDVINLF